MTIEFNIAQAVRDSFPTDGVTITINDRTFTLTTAEFGSMIAEKPLSNYANTRQFRVTTTPYLRIRAEPSAFITVTEVGRLPEGYTGSVFAEPVHDPHGNRFMRLTDGRGWIATRYTTLNDAPVSVTTPAIPNVSPAIIRYIPPILASMRGVHGSAGGWQPDRASLDLIRRNRVEWVLIPSYEKGQAASAIQAYREAGVKHFVIRAAHHGPVTTSNEFLNRTLPTLIEYSDAIGTENMLIALHNEVNLSDEGLGTAWHTPEEFTRWFIEVASGYRARFPWCKIGFPALSPGGQLREHGKLRRYNEAPFFAGCAPAIRVSDWVGVHYYWTRSDGADINPPINQWRTWFSGKALLATEVGPINDSSVNITSAALRRAYEVFGSAGIPMAGWVLEGAGAWSNADWTKNLGGDVI